MIRSWHFLLPALLLGCNSLSDQRRASSQFMQLATESRATRLLPTAENNRLIQAMALVDSAQSCSGVLIGKAVAPESPAYLLTAGHCLMDFQDVSSSQRIFRDALPRSDRNVIHFPKGDFHMGRVVYATMKGVDLAIAEITDEAGSASIYRLTERKELESEDAKVPRALTLRQLKAIGIEPLSWAQKLPDFGDDIRIISTAAGDDNGKEFLREHRCRHEGLADVVESIWHWHNVARNNCEDILPGTSGAPVLNQDDALFAIVNTSSRHALSQDCYLGQPCELTEQSFQVAASRNYGSVVLGLSHCFNAQGVFSLDDARCPLERKASLAITGQIQTPLNPQTLKAQDRRWNIQLQPTDKSSRGFRYKTVRLPSQKCRQSAGYSERLSWSDTRLKALPLPQTAGLHALCLVSEEDFQKSELRHAARVILNVDAVPPQLKPRLVTHPHSQEPFMAVRRSCRNLPQHASFQRRLECAVAVFSFEVQPYEIVDFYYGWVEAKAQDCRAVKNEGRGPHASVPARMLPARLCVWAVDGAGNRAQEPAIYSIRAPARREVIEATDVTVD
jgi:hypothetical protein